MSVSSSKYGTELRRLRAEYASLPRIAHDSEHSRKVAGLMGRLDGRSSFLSWTRHRRAKLAGELSWIESELHGYEAALVLVGRSGSAETAGRGGGRIRQILETRTEHVASLQAELVALDRDLGSIEAEVAEIQQALVRGLEEAVAAAKEWLRAQEEARRARLEAEQAEARRMDAETMWSPVAVMGYRVWLMKPKGLYGAWKRWATSHKRAECAAGRGGIPHTDGQCAMVAFGCGVYAAKSVDELMTTLAMERSARFVVGLVGLEGKVVEHLRGYRAERATALAVAVVDRGTLRFVDQQTEVAKVFGSPDGIPLLGSVATPPPATDQVMRNVIRFYMDQQSRRYETWTSANSSE